MKKIILFLIILASINFVYSSPEVIIAGSSNLSNVNSSEYWDGLDDPTDISTSWLNNDAGFITSYTDTNAETECIGSEVLYGNGSCGEVASVDTNETTRVDALYDNITAFLYYVNDTNETVRVDALVANISDFLYYVNDTNETSRVDALYLNISAFLDKDGHIHDQNLNTTDDVTFNNIVSTGNITVNYFSSDLLPSETVTFDIGSGVSRWGNLYVSNISADDISAYDIDAQNIVLTGELSSPFGNFSDLMVGDVNLSALDTQYLTLSGDNANQNINISNYSIALGGIILDDHSCIDFGTRTTSICESGTVDIDIKSDGRIDIWSDNEVSIRSDGDINDYFHIETNSNVPTLRSYLSNMALVADEGLITITGNVNASGYNISANYFIGDGSLLTGLATIIDTNETVRVDALYANITAFLLQDGYEADTNETVRVDALYSNISAFLAQDGYEADTNETSRVDALYNNISAFLYYVNDTNTQLSGADVIAMVGNFTDWLPDYAGNISSYLAQDGYEADTNDTARVDALYNNITAFLYYVNDTNTQLSGADVIAMVGNFTAWLPDYAGNISSFLAQDGYEADTNETVRVDALYSNISAFLAQDGYEADTNETTRVDALYNNISAFLYYVNDTDTWNTTEEMLIALDNDTIARIGECPEGEFVVNTTTGGVECQAPITSITHYLNASDVTGGSYTDTEDVTDAWYYDSASLNFTEGSGTDPLDIYLNYTGVEDFHEFIIREYYMGSSSHHVQIQIWDYNESEWEDYFEFVGQSGYTVLTIPIYDASDHIENGVVQIRLHHIQNGVSSHELNIDFAWILDGVIVGGSTNLDGYAKYSFGYNSFSGNGNFVTEGDITGDTLFSNNWTNVTITESQISNLAHTVDTNETTRVDALYLNISDFLYYVNDTDTNETTRVDALYNNISDFLYYVNDTDTNETTRVDALYNNISDFLYYVNDTDTNETTRVDALYLNISDFLYYVNDTNTQLSGSDVVAMVGNHTAWLSDYAGNITDFLYYVNDTNDTAQVEALTANISAFLADNDYCSDGTCGSLVISGNLTIIGAYVNATVANQYLNGDMLPSLPNQFNVGSNEAKWKYMVAESFNATNWDNVSITESQISDLAHTVDTDTNETPRVDALYVNISDFLYYVNDTNTQLSGADVIAMVGNFTAWLPDYASNISDFLYYVNDTDTNDTTRVDALYENISAFLLDTDTQISLDQDLNTTSNVEFEGLNTTLLRVGENLKQFISLTDTNITVCSTGCNFTTIQGAVNSLPMKLDNKYEIFVGDGVYNEDVLVQNVMGNYIFNGEEGLFLTISGDTTTPTNVNVSSFLINNIKGMAIKIRGFNIINSNPYTNEEAGIEFYGVDEGIFGYSSFSNGTNGVICYSSKCEVDSINFGIDKLTDSAMIVKHMAIMEEQKGSLGSSGKVGGWAYEIQEGIIWYKGNLSTLIGDAGITNPTNNNHGFAYDSDNEIDFYTRQFRNNIYINNTLTIKDVNVSENTIIDASNFNITFSNRNSNSNALFINRYEESEEGLSIYVDDNNAQFNVIQDESNSGGYSFNANADGGNTAFMIRTDRGESIDTRFQLYGNGSLKMTGYAGSGDELIATSSTGMLYRTPLVVDTNDTVQVEALTANISAFLENTQVSEATVDGYVANDGYFSDIANFTGTLTSGKACTYDGSEIDCASDFSTGSHVTLDQSLNSTNNVEFNSVEVGGGLNITSYNASHWRIG